MYSQLPQWCYKRVALHVVAFLLSHTCRTSSYSQAGSSQWASSPSPALTGGRCITWGSIKDYCWADQLYIIQIEISTTSTGKSLYQIRSRKSENQYFRCCRENTTLTVRVRFRIECRGGGGGSVYIWITGAAQCEESLITHECHTRALYSAFTVNSSLTSASWCLCYVCGPFSTWM